MSATRTAVIGTGRIAEEHLGALRRHPGVDLVAVCDLDPVLAARAARIYGSRPFTDVVELLAIAVPEAVHITTPPSTHVGIARRVIERGVRLVVLEKPAAPDAEELRGLLAMASEYGSTLVEDHNYRFNRPVQQLHALVNSGRLGEVRAVEVRMAMPLATSRYQQSADRRSAEAMRGGVLHEFLPHLCYLGSWLVEGIGDVQADWSKRDPTTAVTPDCLSVRGFGAAGQRLDLLFESDVAPATTTVTVRGSTGWAVADLQLATLRVSAVRGWGAQLDPLVDLAASGVAAVAGAGSSLRAKLRGSPIYEGIGALVALTHDAYRSGGPAPVTEDDMLAAADLADAVLEQKA